MKSIMVMLGLVMLSATSFAQKIANEKVPAAVKEGFKAKFPSVTKSTWEMESASEYEADFKLKDKKYSAKFDKSGHWIETETEISVAALPKVVSETIAKQFPDFKIKEAEKAETSNLGTLYEVKIQKAKQIYAVHLSTDGKIVSKETEKEEDEKE